jgi:uncharacterized protein YndB with AHSA1/START domain
MNEFKFSMTAFERGVLLDIPMDEAYKYAVTAEGIAKWFIGKAEYTAPDGHIRSGDELIQRGDKFNWDWVYKELSLEGDVLDANGKDYVKFTFGKTASVNIKLSEVDGRVLFNLTQESKPDNPMEEFSHINCYVCWTLFVLNLKSVAENGADLREWDYDMHGLVNW